MAARTTRATARLSDNTAAVPHTSRKQQAPAVSDNVQNVKRTTRSAARATADNPLAPNSTCDENTKPLNGRKRKLPGPANCKDGANNSALQCSPIQGNSKPSKQAKKHKGPSPPSPPPPPSQQQPLVSPRKQEPCPPVNPRSRRASSVAGSPVHQAAAVSAAVEPDEPAQAVQPGGPQPPVHLQAPPMQAATFDPSCEEHVVTVRRVLALSGSRAGEGSAPVGRQQQFQQLHEALVSCSRSHLGRSIYISGLPGTGKSFTVQRALHALAQQQQQQQAAPVCITINCMSLTDSRGVYAALLDKCSALLDRKGSAKVQAAPAIPGSSSLGGPDAAHGALVDLLQAYNRRAAGGGKAAGADGKPGPLVVLVLEEVDRLLGKGPEEMYKLFMLPHTPGLHVALVTIANSLDLTERMLPALKCRGASPDFVCFPAYSKSQVQSILTSSMEQLPWKVFEDAALELVSRTVSGTTGDLRQAFKMCSAALEGLVDGRRAAAAAAAPAAPAPTRGTVGLKEMMAAVRGASGGGGAAAAAVATIKALPNQQQLALLAASMVVAAAGAGAADAAATAQAEHSDLPSVSGMSFAAPAAAGAPGRTSGKWKNLNPFATRAAAGVMSPEETGKSVPGAAAAAPGSAARGGAGMTADAAMRVPVRDVYERYAGLCKELFLRPVPLPEFCHTCVLLGEQALLTLSRVGGGVGAGARGRGVAAQGGGQHKLKVSLRVLGKDVKAALQANPIYKKLIGAD